MAQLQPMFENQDPVELFFWGFWEGYCNHLAENAEVIVSFLGG